MCATLTEWEMARNKVKTLAIKEPAMPAFPADKFEVFKNAVMVELANRKNTHDAVWGIDRLVWLVDSELREKVWLQLERVWQAQELRDDVKLDRAVKGMCKAYDAMERWAVANNVSELPNLRQIEHQQGDGTVFVIVPNEASKRLYLQQWQGTTDREVWTAAEIAIIMARQADGKISEIKRQWPDSKLVKVGGPSGFDDMDNDLDMTTPSKTPKLFDTKAFVR
jgi:hypothetical protein